jgi:hypothetical protein
LVIIDKKCKGKNRQLTDESLKPVSPIISMIQLYTHYYSPLFQKNYNDFIESLNIISLTCSSCGIIGNCTRHAFYKRHIITETGKIPIDILRVQCGSCHKTHALLPDWIVPYSQVMLDDMLEILRKYEKGESIHKITPSNPEIDTWNVVYIIKQYVRYWKRRLYSYGFSLFLKTKQLISLCFKHHNRQFMQIKCTVNSLFTPTT